MSKRKIILGMLIAIAIAISGAWLTINQSPVFVASATEQEGTTIQNDAGTFYGQGYYAVGDTATLVAEMNAGYAFDGWVSVAEDGTETCLSTELQYTFVVESNITIKYTYHKIEYSVNFDKNLFNDTLTELKDFTYRINNKTNENDPYYYGSSLEIVVDIKNNVYIYDLNEQNIIINGVSIYNIIRTENPLNVEYNIINDEKTGFSKFVINLDINQNVVIDIDYTYMYKLEILSGNSIDIGEIIKFITLANYYSQPNENEYIYLVRADKQVAITVGQGNDVYKFALSQFQGQDPSIIYSQAYTLYENSTFTVTYNKKDYTVSFNSYLTNLYGNNDLMQNPFYNIDDVLLSAGDTVSFEYNQANKKITITDIVDNIISIYEYPSSVYGYKFAGFAFDGQITASTNYTLDSVKPQDVEIQLIFEYIEYTFEVALIDNYFEDDVIYTISYDNIKNKPIVGTNITVQASVTKNALIGWSWSSTPKVDGYIKQIDSGNTSDTITVNFEPTNDNPTQAYILYLDVDYKYTTASYSLNKENIVKNMDYDVVAVDLNNKVIIFSDSEGISTSKQIEYTEISTDANTGTISINALDMGYVYIEGDELSYSFNSFKVTSIAKQSNGSFDIYTFNKYTYFGDLKLGLVEKIRLIESGNNVTVSFIGAMFDDNGKTTGEIQNFSTTKTYQGSVGAYLIDYHYSMYLYLNNNNAYDYIILRDTKYYFDGNYFTLHNASVNAPKEVEAVITKNSTYGMHLSNVLPNSLLMYYTKSTNVTKYSFTNYTNQIGSSLWSYIYNGYNTSLLSVASTTSVNAEYRQLANNVMLVINEQKAYEYSNIVFNVHSQEENTSGIGNIISAKDGDLVSIIISQNDINKGYKFDKYVFDDEDITDVNNPLILTFTMDSALYSNKIILINFTEIEYVVNINYLDNKGAVVAQNLANGGLRIQGQTTWITKQAVKLTGEYCFEAVANDGYYVSKAYIGSEIESNKLLGLISNNDQQNSITAWELNSDNFEGLIINNSSDLNEVNLYIHFEIHTYSVKVYFEISTNASAIVYPTIYVNNEEQTLIVESEEDSGVSVTKRFILVEGFEYLSNINLQLDNFMMGTTMSYWSDAQGKQIATSNEYMVTQISQNTILKVTLKYVTYLLEFVSLDENGETCSYGSVSTTSKTIKLFDVIYYTVNTDIGYVLSNKYYYDKTNALGTGNINSGFIFNPSNFKIEGSSVKIYLVFTLKVVNLEVSNTVEGGLYYFKGQNANNLLSYTISRQRGELIKQLNDETGYQFQTGDILVMEIKPISIGIELTKVQLGNTNITLSSVNPYMLKTKDIKEDNTLVGMYYELYVEFTAGVINNLEDTTLLKNVLKVKTFNITYTYNYIDYKFGIRLIRQYSGSTATGKEDKEMLIKTVGYGTQIMFRYDYVGMNSGDGEKFRVDGFSVDGIKQNVTDKFVFEDINLWNQIVLNKYRQNSQQITVVLLLKPKITLHNYTSYSESEGYLYENTYIGETQGLRVSGSSPDIMVGGDFETIIHYSFDGGMSYIDQKPIDVGEYHVRIVAKITSENAQVTEVMFEEKVKYSIIQASLTISLRTYDSSNPVTKVYDGTNNLSSKTIANDMVFNGLYARDVNNVFVDISRLRVQFSDISVNKMTALYDVNVFDIYLLDNSGNSIKNYRIPSGQNLIFSRIGKINPKELTITGFVAKNKVYDDTNEVVANVEGITYLGKLSSDSTQILTENLKFYVEDYSIGYNKEVFIDWSTALVGADSINYSIIYTQSFIDIYPYEISYYLKDYGTFKVVDVDRLCLIPIESRMFARAFDKGTNDYRLAYGSIEPQIGEGEKLKACYEIVIQVGSVNLSVPEGLYIYLPKPGKVVKVLQLPDEDNTVKLELSKQEDFSVVKVVKGDALFGVVARTTYLPLWSIILIIAGALLLIGGFVAIFILFRRKAKNKYSAYNKI